MSSKTIGSDVGVDQICFLILKVNKATFEADTTRFYTLHLLAAENDAGNESVNDLIVKKGTTIFSDDLHTEYYTWLLDEDSDIIDTIMLTVFDALLQIIEAGIIKLAGDRPEGIQIEKTLSFCDPAFGDLSTNLALQLASKLGQTPLEMAAELARELGKNDLISQATVAGPGFVNLTLSDQCYYRLKDMADKDFYRTNIGEGKKVNVEFISANPTGPLVLVNAWGGYYGDILANVFVSQGYAVSREYFVNDGGQQIGQLGRAVQQAAGRAFSKEISAELYRGPYVDQLAETLVRDFGSKDELLEADPQIVGDKAQHIILTTMIRPTLDRLGIRHETMYSESTLDNQATLDRLCEKAALKEADGALWLDGEKAGLDKDEVLVRSTDNQETYFLKDITYQLTKLEDRDFDRAVTIVGPDHHGQEKRLVAALELLGAHGFVPLWTQTVRLIKDGAEFKMSKRRGNYIVLDDFLDLVPSDTARFFFAMRDTNTHFDLDLNLIQSQNKHNPLFYVMYSYVRAQSILSKAGSEPAFTREKLHSLEPGERGLWRKALELSISIQRTTVTYQVHSILYQVIELARLFHDWYEKHPILQESNDELRWQRLAIVECYHRMMGGIFDLLGITPQEHM